MCDVVFGYDCGYVCGGCDVERWVVYLDAWRRDAQLCVELVRVVFAGELHLVVFGYVEGVGVCLREYVERLGFFGCVWFDDFGGRHAGDLTLVVFFDDDFVVGRQREVYGG